MVFRALVLLLFSAALAPRTGPAQDPPPTFSASVNLVKVPISVFAVDGRMMEGLRAEDFRLWEDRAPQEIRSFGLDTYPVSVVLLVDTSPSSRNELKRIRAAATEFVRGLDAGDRFSVISFDDEVTRILDWTDSRKKLDKALGKLRAGVRTALYDAMYLAAAEQLKNVEGRKAIVLFTDCLDNQSRVGLEEAERAIAKSQASLYVVSKTAIVANDARRERRVVILNDIYRRLFGEDEDYIEEFFRKREGAMTELAEETGGRSFFPTDYDQIRGIYADVAREMKSRYFLTYVSNQALEPDSYHRIAVECLRPAARVVYRKGYYHLPRMPQNPRLSSGAFREPE
ncbi:MAG: VWA domain-containing protein [Acidobacteria bacterium]|nr:VWA domain-containing protein [Acidobacteriota bacterium]